jgi:hypothetical protein
MSKKIKKQKKNINIVEFWAIWPWSTGDYGLTWENGSWGKLKAALFGKSFLRP